MGRGVDAHSVSRIQLAKLLDAFTSHSSVLVVEALLENGREDLAEGIDGTDRLEDRANSLTNRFFAVPDLFTMAITVSENAQMTCGTKGALTLAMRLVNRGEAS